MLIFGDNLIGMPVLSIQTSQELARTKSAVIDPAHLTIPAFYVTGPTLDFTPALLRTADIRELNKIGAIINSSDELVSPDDLVKLKEVLELNFTLEGKTVIDEHKQKLGKVHRYTIEPSTFVIQQLHVKRPFLQSFNDSELLINRSQIIGVNHNFITVKAPDIKTGSAKKMLSNPFQQTQPKAEAMKASEN